MGRKIYFLIVGMIALFFISGCVAKTVDVEKNSKLISVNADNMSKLTDVVNSYHKNDLTDKLKADMKVYAEEAFKSSQDKKSLVSDENIQKGLKTAGSLSEMAGIPYGGVAMDLIAGFLTMFGGAKLVKNRSAENARRKEEEEKWVKYLASLPPDDAKKAMELNS